MKVYPVPYFYLSTVPAIEHDCDGEGFHEMCLAAGAFTTEPPPEVPAEPADEDPADAGSLSAEE